MKNIYLIIVIVLGAFEGQAQGIISEVVNDDGAACGSYHLMEHADSKVPGYLEASNEQLMQIAQSKPKLKKKDDELLEIQVVFHVVYNNEEENIPDSVFINQMKVLNESFMRTNADTVDMRPIYKDIAGNPNIRFTLATQDPLGNPTNGITRTSTSITEFGGTLPYGQGQNVEIRKWVGDSLYPNYSRISSTENGGIDPWDPDKYLNIWVGDLRIFEPKFDNLREIFFFAFATPPNSHPNFDVPGLDLVFEALDDGVYMHFPVPGPNNPTTLEAPYNASNGVVTEGKMLVHEVGHYLGLRHIWGDGGCSAEDFIDDTPNSNSSSQYQCNKGRNTCVDDINGVDLPDMLENYMDYSGSSCMNSFTKDQVWVMREAVRRGRASFVSVDEIEVANLFSVYPNPSNGMFTLKIRSSYADAQYSVLDAHGRILVQGDIVQNTVKIDLDGAQGVYYLEVVSDGLVQRKRILKL
jgi:hypothetical protein